MRAFLYRLAEINSLEDRLGALSAPPPGQSRLAETPAKRGLNASYETTLSFVVHSNVKIAQHLNYRRK